MTTKQYRSREWQGLDDSLQHQIEALQNAPKIPIGKIAESLGLVVKLSTLPANISGEIRPSNEARAGYTIKINKHEAKTRQRFTLAHEIAHFLLHRDQIGDGIADTVLYRSSLSDTREAEANRLAADLIMPWNILRQQLNRLDINNDFQIEALSQVLGVSKVALKVRLGLEQ